MKRDIEQALSQWKDHPDRLPLLLRGARQIGKSFVVEKWGASQFANVVVINFELQPHFAAIFQSLDAAAIVQNIALLTNQALDPQKTLLFFDEIQECPQAIQALRYFKEQLPAWHVIAAGSLLEFTLNDAQFRMPVGRVQSFYLHPLSFKEYLTGTGHDNLRQLIEQVSVTDTIASPVHHKLLQLVQEYSVWGGMPAVVNSYATTRDVAHCVTLQNSLLQTYRNDFGKYASRTNHKYLQRLFEQAPFLVGEHFKYSKVARDMRARDLKQALDMLMYAGLISPIYASAASGIPLQALVQENKFKLLFLDIGLVTRAHRIETQLLLHEDNFLLVNRGALAEQFVGQELLVCGPYDTPGALYFWYRDKPSSTAEVDYVISYHDKIIPIEVKAGSTGRLKSLKLFLNEQKSPLGVRISQNPLGQENDVLSLPLYLTSEIHRFLRHMF